MELRLSLIQTILDFYHEEIKQRTNGGSSRCIHVLASERELCDKLILGGIWGYLVSANQEFLPKEASKVVQSANQLISSLSQMFSELLVLDGNHKTCSPLARYTEFVAGLRVDTRWVDVLRPHHLERMDGQRRKTGLCDTTT